ncbi:SurA N-terminal domain-containing protein [Brevibacillus agri]|uniref:SurA N-terminal domain-containing protein n=1 Tax=Brevibacillus agri TaxID=51101 RepID=UPI001EE5254F|nr:SurA N-terminal domain-containing protein [Brevibacillus agri]MCG5254840.1 SurA N-terminal domain-containing protein [Brevibacillus agri]
MKKFDVSLLTISILILSLVIMGMSEKEEPRVIAKVNGTTISESQYLMELQKQYGEQILDQLITETLIIQEAEKKNVNVTENQVISELEKMKENMGSPERFNQFLEQYKMTEDQVKERIKINMLLNNIFVDKVQVTEEEMKSFYEENKDRFGSVTPSYEQVKNLLKERILEDKKQEQIPVWIDELKKKAKIEKVS